MCSEFGAAAAGAAAGAGCGQAFVGVGDDEVALEFGDRGQGAVDEPAFGDGGVDALLEEPEPDLALAELIQQRQEVRGGALDPVQSRAHQHPCQVAGPGRGATGLRQKPAVAHVSAGRGTAVVSFGTMPFASNAKASR